MSNQQNNEMAESINEYYDDIWNALNLEEKTEVLEQCGYILKHTGEQRDYIKNLGEARQPLEVMKKAFIDKGIRDLKNKVLAG